MLERYGTMELSDVIAPAISYAAAGIPNYEYMLDRLHSIPGQQQFDNFPPGGWDVFYHDREVPPAGSLLVQPGLANTLRTLRDAAAEAPGDRSQRMQAARDAFYRGPIAKLIAECSDKVGGIISTDDLASYHSRFETPVGGSFHGYEINGQDSWTQGPMLMQTLNILENFDLKAMGHNSPAYIHTVAEALKLGFGDREAFYADPGYATVPMDGLLSKEYAAERAQLIDPEGAYPAQPPAGDPWRFSKHQGATPSPVMSEPAAAVADPSAADGTTHVSVLDRRGNLVCGTISGGSFAKSVFFPELGCALSTRIEMFNCDPGHPNVVEPGKRPRTTLVNYIIAKEGQPVMTVGCPGGDNQVQANVQLMLNSFVFGMDPQQAVEAPRFLHRQQRQFLLSPRLLSGPTRPGAGNPRVHRRCAAGSGAQDRTNCQLWTRSHCLGPGRRDRLPQRRRRPAARLLRPGLVGIIRPLTHVRDVAGRDMTGACPS